MSGDERNMRIAVVGGGYVGLVTSVCLAELGHTVQLVEIDKNKVALFNSGSPPINENGLEGLLLKHINQRLIATTRYEDILESDIIIICVGTPPDQEGHTDLSMVESASKSIGNALRYAKDYCVLVVKSTVPPGTTQKLVIPTILGLSGKTDCDVGFVMNPEFLREGLAIQDFMKPDRIVIGSLEDKAGSIVESMYQGLNASVIHTGLIEAEMIKYASNAFLAAKISFSNEIGNICKKLCVNVYEVMRGVGMDSRIGSQFLNAGIGFGGSCFPKDVASLIHLAEDVGEDPVLLKSIVSINEHQPIKLIDLLEKKMGGLKNKRIAVLGLAFKNDTDDVRDSRSIPVIRALLGRGARVAAYDPLGITNMKKIIPDIDYCASAAIALNDADACLVLTEWPEFSLLNKEFDLMKGKIILEGRRILSKDDVEGICW
jgi:UDPglucose 6-dehydrogenase